MVELRWTEYYGWDVPKGSIETSSGVFQVLEFRVMENIAEIGIQEPIWSEWMPVPFHE